MDRRRKVELFEQIRLNSSTLRLLSIALPVPAGRDRVGRSIAIYKVGPDESTEISCANSGRSSTQIGKLNLSHRRGNASQRLNHVVNAAIVESLEVTGLRVMPPDMGKLGVGHCLQSEKR